MYFVNINLIFLFRILLQIYYQKTSYERERDIRARCVANFLESELQITCRFHVPSPPWENKSMEMRTIIPTRFPSRGWIFAAWIRLLRSRTRYR